ncbi:sugar ABC transporter substrate-binding protein [Ralstonia solanacearum]|uniref:Sugar ABC transporter substrate-binding protein n=1 Tax=Ralstonia solanacearum TaxID=305 RepID=A0AAW5ZLZ8_RALSL|nr:sugar ABC transporter substrate-binding protein [Ralstonia solanacearum]ATJ86263.1 rhizopine-binding protein [Ralstonia solanacearum]AYB51829.1 sugar ABC transporter substrate-binding protein [Ralstonia solanacearum]AYB56383.1 sugar ABC transporter substrate-binding protein [Ralstonia solanacearum]MDB0508896.1 sugar ABC transporter substrate-binding protein [Ralstonia solanacearum]MDB0514161.1 sugar ABC transporter substrate-binding protein [Ralstonia solanacearum]
MKRWMAFAAAWLLPLAVFAQTKIGVSISAFDDNFLTLMRQAMQAHAKTLKDVDVQFEDARADVGRQISQVETFISQKASAIIVNPVDTSATARMTEAARRAGIPLVYVNRKPFEKLGNGAVFVGSDELVAGRLQMEYLARQMGGKGNLAIMQGGLSADAARVRTQGVMDIVKKYPGIKVVEQQTANWQRNEALNLMSRWLSAGTRIDAVASNNDEMAIGALLAMRQAGISPKTILVAGVDATPDGLAELRRGGLVATVFQDAKGQGRGAVDAAVKMAAGAKDVPPEVLIPFELVTPDNYQTFAKR